MIEITTPVGRVVGGHPMVSRANTDTKTGLPKMQKDGVTPSTSVYIGLAIPKGAEQQWNQTEWGAKIWAEALASWPAGEYQQPTFSWKVTDGDSQIPNKKMKKPCDREGYPGHWVIQASTGLGAVKCYNVGKYNPLTDLIQQKEMIKPGDYARLVIDVKTNAPSETAGMYVNPVIFELYQPGQAIILESEPDAAGTLGASVAQLPANALIDNNIPTAGVVAPVASVVAPVASVVAPVASVVAPVASVVAPVVTPGTVAPAPDFLTPPTAVVANKNYNGQIVTVETLVASGWAAEQIAALPDA